MFGGFEGCPQLTPRIKRRWRACSSCVLPCAGATLVSTKVGGWALRRETLRCSLLFQSTSRFWTTCRATIGIPGWWMLLGRLQQRGHRQRRLFHAYGSISPCSCAGILVVDKHVSGSSSPYAKAVRSVRHVHAISKRDLNCRVLVKLHTSCIKHMKMFIRSQLPYSDDTRAFEFLMAAVQHRRVMISPIHRFP